MKFVQNNSYSHISFTIYVLHIQSSQLKCSHKLVVNIHFIFVSHFTCIIQLIIACGKKFSIKMLSTIVVGTKFAYIHSNKIEMCIIYEVVANDDGTSTNYDKNILSYARINAIDDSISLKQEHLIKMLSSKTRSIFCRPFIVTISNIIECEEDETGDVFPIN